MIKFKNLLGLVTPLALFAAIMFFLWGGLKRDPHNIPSPLLNKPAPLFEASSLQNPQQTLTQADLQGHVTILNVFATWCENCRMEHSVWIEANRDLQQQTKIIGLNYKDDRDKAQQWLIQYGNPYSQVIYDPRGTVGINFGVYGTPETFIIDKQGIIRYKEVGAVSPAQFTDIILPIVKKWENAA